MAKSPSTSFDFREGNGPTAKKRSPTSISLTLLYTDTRYDIELKESVTAPIDLPISQLIKDLLRFASVDNIPEESIRLVRIIRDRIILPGKRLDLSTPLYKLDITDNSIVEFGPTTAAPEPQPTQLTVWGPDDQEKYEFTWYKAKTTLQELLLDIMKRFSLLSIGRERIHLLTSYHELNILSDLDSRLSTIGVYDRTSIHVVISPSTSRTEKKIIHVQCQFDEEKLSFDISFDETLRGLKTEIDEALGNRPIYDFKVFDANDAELHLDDLDRRLNSFGIKNRQTILVKFSLIDPKVEKSPTKELEKLSSSTNQRIEDDDAIIICQFSTVDILTFRRSVRKTINEIIKETIEMRKTRQYKVSKVQTESKTIDPNEFHRCLADFGVQPGEKIRLNLTETKEIHSSIVSKTAPKCRKIAKSAPVSGEEKKPLGLDNLGNSCYMNSAFQCLAHVAPLTNFFLEKILETHRNDPESGVNNDNPFAEVGRASSAYADLLWLLWKSDNEKSLKPLFIREMINRLNVDFNNSEQQDVQEFLSFLLDAIHTELKRKCPNEKETIITELFFGQIQTTITCKKCRHQESVVNPISFISLPLKIQERRFWVNFIPMKGEHQSESITIAIDALLEHLIDAFTLKIDRSSLFFNVLPIVNGQEIDFHHPLDDIPGDEIILMEQETKHEHRRPSTMKSTDTVLTLTNCLDGFLSDENLIDQWTCPKENCRSKSQALKQTKFAHLPRVLLFQLKRFSHKNGVRLKVETKVDFPLRDLRLNRLVPSSNEDLTYDLIAVCNHIGSIHSGHYTTCARRMTSISDNWFRFDDSRVKLISPKDYDWYVVNDDAYLLVYVRRDLIKTNLEIEQF